MTSRVILSLSFLLIALSIGYYFLYYLPEKDKTQLQLQLYEEKLKDWKVKQQQANAENLQNCLAQADNSYTQYWNNQCKAQGLSDNCNLPTDSANYINNAIKSAKDLCFKQYPQNNP